MHLLILFPFILLGIFFIATGRWNALNSLGNFLLISVGLFGIAFFGYVGFYLLARFA